MYLEPSDENARRLFERDIEGPVTMLNPLRFRQEADYSGFPHLAPPEPISGSAASGSALSREFRLHVARAVRGRLDSLVDTLLSDELASMVWCKPNRDALRRESLRLRLRFLVPPFAAARTGWSAPTPSPGSRGR